MDFGGVPASASKCFIPGGFAVCKTHAPRLSPLSIASVGKSDIQELQQLLREALHAWAGFVVVWCIRRSVVGCLAPLQSSQAQGAEQGAQVPAAVLSLSVKLLGKFRFCGRYMQKRGTDL